MAAISRIDFLRGSLKGHRQAVRPPWSVGERTFTEICDGCGDCKSACRQSIVVMGRGRYPEVDFQRGVCTLCGDCTKACPTGALSQVKMSLEPPWALAPRIDDRCLARHQVVCRTCADRCGPRAITFKLTIGGVAQPQIDDFACTGCGECVSSCPRQAIDLSYRETLHTEPKRSAKGVVA